MDGKAAKIAQLMTLTMAVIGEVGGYTSMIRYNQIQALVKEVAHRHESYVKDDRPGIVYQVVRDGQWYFLRHSISNPAKLTPLNSTMPGMTYSVIPPVASGTLLFGTTTTDSTNSLTSTTQANLAQVTGSLIMAQEKLARCQEIITIVAGHSPGTAEEMKGVIQIAENEVKKLTAKKAELEVV